MQQQLFGIGSCLNHTLEFFINHIAKDLANLKPIVKKHGLI